MSEEKKAPKGSVKGNFLLFFAFDVGDEIDLLQLRRRRLVPVTVPQVSSYFKNYHKPLAFDVADCYEGGAASRTDCVSSKVHTFGVISFCYKVPFAGSLEDAKSKFIEIYDQYSATSKQDALAVFSTIKDAIIRPSFFNLRGEYFGVQVDPVSGLDPAEFKEMYAQNIASLIRFERESLSEYQQDAILSSSTGYYGEDMVVIDGQAAFVYDFEYFELIEFFESATIQRLELQYFDRLLDRKLNQFYSGDRLHIESYRSYIPMLKAKEDRLVEELARLRVDISVIVDRLEGGFKLSGDPYYEEVYSMLVNKMQIKDWKESVANKLEIVQDLCGIHKYKMETLRMEILTIVIIVLVALEAWFAFARDHKPVDSVATNVVAAQIVEEEEEHINLRD